jgi:hypothetical protein
MSQANDLSRSLIPFEQATTLVAVIDDTASYCAPFYVTKTAGFSDRGFVLPGNDD